jgi:thioredoxin 1
MSVLKLTKENFDTIQNTDKKVLIDFYAEWCGPCKMVSPIVDELAKEHPEFLIAKVNVDEEQSLAAQFGVMSIPTLVVIENGKILKQSVGAMPKAKILEMLEAN